jgi:hypothetical protein
MHKLTRNYTVATWFNLIRIALAMATVFLCGYTRAMCIAPLIPNGADPLKAAIKYAVDTSEAVFTGYVNALEYVPVLTERGNAERLVIRMTARAWWKGDRTDEVTLNTSTYRYPDGMMSSEVHGYPFESGKTYLVYAFVDHGGLSTSICARTKPIETGAQDIEVLDAVTNRVTDLHDAF